MIDPSRRTPSRYDFIDRLRGAGILLVILYHAVLVVASQPVHWQGNLWDPRALPLAQGVLQLVMQWLQLPTLFFVISGFLVHRSHLRRPDRPATAALLHRVLRLYVPYLIALLLFGLLLPSTRLDLDADGALLQLLTHLSLTFNLRDDTLWTINASFWYVATELQLCLLYPLVLPLARRFGFRAVMIAVTGIALAMRTLSTLNGLHPDAEMVKNGIALGEDWFANGAPAYLANWMLGAWLADRRANGLRSKVLRSDVAALALLGLLATVIRPLSVFAPLAMAFAMAAFFERQVDRSEARASPAVPLPLLGRLDESLRYLGSISLAIYLLNQPLVRIIGWRLVDHGPQLAMIALTTVMASVVMVVAGTAFTLWLERPAGRWLGALIDRRLQPPAAAPVSR